MARSGDERSQSGGADDFPEKFARGQGPQTKEEAEPLDGNADASRKRPRCYIEFVYLQGADLSAGVAEDKIEEQQENVVIGHYS